MHRRARRAKSDRAFVDGNGTFPTNQMRLCPKNAHPRRKPAELRDCKGTATFHSESDRHAIDHGNVIGGNSWPIGQTCTILLPISDRGTARGGAIEGIHSYETGFSSQHFCFLGGLARSETLRFWRSGMTAAGTGSLVAEQCRHKRRVRYDAWRPQGVACSFRRAVAGALHHPKESCPRTHGLAVLVGHDS